MRRQLYPKTKQTIAGVDVIFAIEHPQDQKYHEVNSEEPVIADIISTIDENEDVFYDIGANIGLYACVVSKKLNPGSVVAFEPSPPAFERLQRNAALNGDQFNSYQIAVSNTDEVVSFSVDVKDRYSRQSTLHPPAEATRYETTEIPSKTLSSIVKKTEFPPPTIVKIDVEGAEFEVIQGMEELIDVVRVIYCEIHDTTLTDLGTGSDEIIQYLENSGYHIEHLDQHGDNSFIKAIRPSGNESG